MKTIASIGIAALLGCSLAAGCSFHARDAESYRKATRELLETRSGDIKSCYDVELQRDPKAAGTVVVKFTVKKESGKIVDAKVDEVASSAPTSLGQCVVRAIDGLALEPPDERNGDATFRWEFQLKG
jgi:hypothetical protein